MATRVGTVAVGTTVSAAKTITAGHAGIAHIKWEAGAVLNSSFNDSLGNTWTVASQVLHSTGNEPGSAMAYCLSFTTGGSMTLTPTFASGTPTFQHIELESWQPTGGTSFALNGAVVNAQGSAGGGAVVHNATSTTASGPGCAFQGISDFNTLGLVTAGGSPTFTVGGGAANGDSYMAYATVTGAGTVAPSTSVASGTTRYIEQLLVLVEVSSTLIVANKPKNIGPGVSPSKINQFKTPPRGRSNTSPVSVTLTGNTIVFSQSNVFPRTSRLGSVKQAGPGIKGPFNNGQFIAKQAGVLFSSVNAVTLTGLSVSSAPGTLVSDIQETLTGQTSSVSVGTLSSAIAESLSGGSITTVSGNLSSSIAESIGGQAVSFVQDFVIVGGNVSVTIAGTLISSSIGNVLDALGQNISGQSAAVAQGTITQAITTTISGNNIAFNTGIVSPSGGATAATITIKAGSWLRYKAI
jgi:hypothetical protein